MLYMFRTPFASIIRSTINCNSSHWCLSWIGLEWIMYRCQVRWALYYSMAKMWKELFPNLSPFVHLLFIIGIQPLGRSGQKPEFSQAAGMALVRYILGKFLGVACHCFPPLFRCSHLSYKNTKSIFTRDISLGIQIFAGSLGESPGRRLKCVTRYLNDLQWSRTYPQIDTKQCFRNMCLTFQLKTNTPITETKDYFRAGSKFLRPLMQHVVNQCLSTGGPRPDTGPWHQLYRAARGLRKLQYATRFHWSSDW